MNTVKFKQNVKFFTLLLSLCLLLSGCRNNLVPFTKGQSVDQYVDSLSFSGAVLIVDQGEIVLSKGVGLVDRKGTETINADTVFRLGSVSKQFTATAILLLQQKGLLNIDEPVATYLPDFPHGDIISIKNLLQHTSGIPNYTEFKNFGVIATQYHSPAQLVAMFKDLPLEFTPGTRFNYSNSGYVLLGYLIEVVSGISYEEFITTEIFSPLLMTRSGYGENTFGNDNIAHGYTSFGAAASPIDMSVPYAAGALSSTLNDLFRWDHSFYENALLTKASKALLYRPGLNNYAMGWTVSTGDNGRVYHHGGLIHGFSSFIARYPEEQRLIVVLANEEGYDVAGLADQLNKLINSN
ncbi:serine hydrolase domain-containing protein [Aliivibrio fischeri]|uniref:Serine hydrolase n=1 Tax=Aliivibrio fischeri TaxID=668 RepID=A0A844P074_ALIFS|nr:serine hydrolase domain-containing protein [Aliivibrio fischeri]MCE7534516.1 beta-lactamase family protein [Aliivibrio fischeri]MCE7554137.1 beta-lactamase family protein [Aliivibrio fischeri]MCE7557648.1 beta-lactamase family protein [Aliivibrio fischeri]MCE7561011.1 beta-lactamase family protein [Aliivibrio fischeri]MCE7564681.1 beta-lactamase family protein [Aliivibrio fischeri]